MSRGHLYFGSAVLLVRGRFLGENFEEIETRVFEVRCRRFSGSSDKWVVFSNARVAKAQRMSGNLRKSTCTEGRRVLQVQKAKKP